MTRTGMVVETDHHQRHLDVYSSSSSEVQLRRMLGPSADGKGEAQAWLEHLSRLRDTIFKLIITRSWRLRLCRSLWQWLSTCSVVIPIMHC